MAQMERNVNLEEIDSDALFGIDALKNQTILQKIIFISCMGLGVIANVCLPLLFKTPRVFCVLIFLVLILIGIAYGCNYTQDMTYGRYIYCYFFKPKKTLLYQSTEDIGMIRERSKEIRKEEDALLKKERQADLKAQRRLLIKLIVFIAIVATIVTGALVYAKAIRGENPHHEADWSKYLEE